jgi:hypothetical protein
MILPHGAQYDAPDGSGKAHRGQPVCRRGVLGRALPEVAATVRGLRARPWRDRAPFNAWIAQQELLWRASVGYDAKRPLTPRRLAEFERWLEQRANATPEHIAPIVDRVMAGILSHQRGRAS